VAESGIASGVRRIEAVTGEGALQRISADEALLDSLAALLKAGRTELADRLQQLLDKNRTLEKELKIARNKLAGAAAPDLAAGATEIGGLRVLAVRLADDTDADALRDTVDRMKAKLGSAVVVLGAATADGKVRLAAGVTPDVTGRIKAGDLIRDVAGQVGGKGGGRPDFAQAGGSNPAGLDKALAGVNSWVEARIA
jgi:alanyl-tRNA synthetase